MLSDVAPSPLEVDHTETETPAMLTKLGKHRKHLREMMLELQANQVTLKRTAGLVRGVCLHGR